jgi:WD40 repeat protein
MTIPMKVCNLCPTIVSYSLSANVISSLEFNPSGEYLASGDYGGSISIYKKKETVYKVVDLLHSLSLSHSLHSQLLKTQKNYRTIIRGRPIVIFKVMIKNSII